jgi:M61 glycyl aminopeptidase
MRRAIATACFALSCAARVPTTRPSVWERRVAYRDGAVLVTTCFGEHTPARLDARDRAYPFTLAARDGEASRRIDARGPTIEVPQGTRCLEQRIDARGLRRGGGDLVLRNSGWLFAPSPLVVGSTVRTRFDLPEGWQVSTPWPRAEGVYTMDATAMRWEGYTVIGPLTREEFTIEGTVFDVTREDFADPRTPPVEAWLGDAWRAARSLVPGARPPRIQVLLRATERGGAPVSFGLVSRGGGPSVMFFVDPSAREEDLRGDWHATHEFVHLVHPVFFDRDAWLREGLATYYQEVLRARSGAITADAAWASLAQGIAEGIAEGRGATLAEESAAMGRTHRYHRVYWWGVAVALMVDVRIRSISQGRASLDTGLGALYEASLRAPERAWSAREAFEVIELATSVPVWDALVGPALASEEFPAVVETLRALGVQARVGAGSGLDDGAPMAAVRASITRGR